LVYTYFLSKLNYCDRDISTRISFDLFA